MTVAVRLAPSGPPVLNANGGTLGFGDGARLRLVEANTPMTGTVAIPTTTGANDGVICPDGFTATDAVVLTLGAPNAGLKYRAVLALDVVNTSTNLAGSCELFLDASIDGGATYTNIYNNTHAMNAAGALPGEVRQMQLWAPLTSGQALGVVNGTTTSLKLRARVRNLTGILAVSSTGGTGTIHMELEECF